MNKKFKGSCRLCGKERKNSYIGFVFQYRKYAEWGTMRYELCPHCANKVIPKIISFIEQEENDK